MHDNNNIHCYLRLKNVVQKIQKQHLEFHALAFSVPRLVDQYPLAYLYLKWFFGCCFYFFHGKRVKIVKEHCSLGKHEEV